MLLIPIMRGSTFFLHNLILTSNCARAISLNVTKVLNEWDLLRMICISLKGAIPFHGSPQLACAHTGN